MSHHCSYKALNEQDKGNKKTSPVPQVKWLLEKQNRQTGAIIVSTSDKIPPDETTQPPHRQAAKYYEDLAKAIAGEFIVTMEHPKPHSPEPLVMNIDKFGATIEKRFAAISTITSHPAPRAG